MASVNPPITARLVTTAWRGAAQRLRSMAALATGARQGSTAQAEAAGQRHAAQV